MSVASAKDLAMARALATGIIHVVALEIILTETLATNSHGPGHHRLSHGNKHDKGNSYGYSHYHSPSLGQGQGHINGHFRCEFAKAAANVLVVGPGDLCMPKICTNLSPNVLLAGKSKINIALLSLEHSCTIHDSLVLGLFGNRIRV